MPIENTDLERRVLAHEQILQALMAQMAEAQPGFLNQMLERFAGVRRGSYEHDYVETADYAEAFLGEVLRLGRLPKAAPRPVAMNARPFTASASETVRTVVIRTASIGGVWHVTQDSLFLGDYLSEEAARQAAMDTARRIEREGGVADTIFEGRCPH